MAETINGDFEMLDGFDDLPDEDQERVRRALEQGHVDDDEWKGVSSLYTQLTFMQAMLTDTQDVEKNRPGQSGFRMTAAQRAKKEKEEAGSVSIFVEYGV